MENVPFIDGIEQSKLGIQGLPQNSDEIWDKSPIGNPREWPPVLRAFGAFTATLPHPAAIYWGDRLVLIHNPAWEEAAGGQAQQGMPQDENLSEEALSALRTAMHGRTRRNLHASLLLNGAPKDGNDYHVLLSPIMEKEGELAKGVVAQLFYMNFNESPKHGGSNTSEKDVDNVRAKSMYRHNTTDELPLDEHPFFQRFAAMLPTGLAILNHKAEAVFVNQQFYDLTTTQLESNNSFKAWPQTIHPDDYDRVMTAYRSAFKSGQQLRCEFRCQSSNDPWRLLLLTPLGDDNLRQASLQEYGGFICAIIDITPNKAQELAQKKAAKEAQERKEQQERFIDMISHEIRNPLSAVLHCAEDVMETIQSGADGSGKTIVSVASIAEAAETIMLCVAHQKNIVDDILSFSKLDASMLSLSPKNVQPKRQLADSLKMFQSELRKQSMAFEYKVDISYDEFRVDWVKADLVRISQVLVNLVTNSIKFTVKKDGEKKISVFVGASLHRPTSYPPNVVFFDTDDLGYRMDGTNTSEWGNGEALYIMVAVKDSGIGINKDNQTRLFERFRQATPKTEEIYGGSGLGLNISRKLCQLHGGEIGVSSKEGVGSTFGFFFKVRRAEIEADSGDAPPQHERLGRDELRDQVQDVTDGGAPIQTVLDDKARKDLNDPPSEHVPKASPAETKDERWQNTAEIASKVQQIQSDEYGISGRPGGPKNFESHGDTPSKLVMLQRQTDSEQSIKHLLPQQEPGRQSEASKILLVEDNVINQRILRRKLESKGFHVTTANNGREAVDAVHQASSSASEAANHGIISPKEQLAAKFDVILMDQEMPVLDGNSATKVIRELERDGSVRHIPILGVTANVREAQKADMMSAGMDDVISKPYGIDEMVEKIGALITKGQE